MKTKKEEWKGYTLAELKMHRAINAVRLEVEKERIMANLDAFKNGAAGSVTSFLFKNLGTVSRSIGMATTVFAILRKGYKLFKGK